MGRPANQGLRQDLVDAARIEFAIRGLADTRVEDITRRAGTSKGAFYLLFQHKEEAYEAICREFLTTVMSLLRHSEAVLSEALGKDGVRQMIEGDVVLCRFLWERRDALRMVLEGGCGSPFASLADEFVTAIEEYFRATLASDLEAHRRMAPGIDPDVVALVATGAFVMGVRRILRAPEPPDFRRLAIEIRRLLWGGLFVPDVGQLLLAALDDMDPGEGAGT